MIKQLNKIDANTISMWLNIVGFVAGIVFYVRMERVFQRQAPAPQTNRIKDSVLVIDTQLKAELKCLKKTQDSLLKVIQVNTLLLKKQQTIVRASRHQVLSTLKTDFQSLSEEEQDAYIRKLLSTLKSQTP